MKLLLVVGIAVLVFSGLNAQKLKLKDALGMPEAHELDTVDLDVENGLSDILSGLLDKMRSATGFIYRGIEHAVYKLLVALMMPDTGAALKAQFKSTLASLREKVDYKPLKKLITKLLGDGKNTLSSSNSFVDEDYVEELAKHLIEEITTPEGLQKIRAYVESLASKSKLEVVHALRELLKKLDDSKLKMAITSLLTETPVPQNGISEIFHAIKEMFKTFGSSLIRQFKPFRDWALSKWSDIKEQLAEKVPLVKAIAEVLIGDKEALPEDIAEEAEDLLQRYKTELGDLYEPLMKKLHSMENTTTIAPEY